MVDNERLIHALEAGLLGDEESTPFGLRLWDDDGEWVTILTWVPPEAVFPVLKHFEAGRSDMLLYKELSRESAVL